jgi:nucleotide-binding universal stress UspA family protein
MVRCVLIADSEVLDREINFGELGVKEVYVIFAENGRTVVTLSEKGEALKLAENKLAAIKKAEELVNVLERYYSVSGLSVTFSSIEEEIIHAVEIFNPDIIVAYKGEIGVLISIGIPVALPQDGIEFENVLYVHAEGADISWLRRCRRIILAGIVEPVLPPEASSRIMEERRRKLEKEIEKIADQLAEPERVNKIVVRGSAGDVVRKMIELNGVNLLILSRGLGREKIEEILKNTKNTETSVILI